MSITDCYFNNHSALGQGGAIYAKSGNNLTVESSEFYINYA